MLADFRYAIRMLLKNPGFTAVAVLTLALGIGANTAIFSAVNAVLIRPLPYQNPEQLVWLFANRLEQGYTRLPPNWANETFSDLREQCQSFSESAMLRGKDFLLQTGDGSVPTRGMRASANLFGLLGIRPALGRTFTAEENEWGRHRVLILSHEFWQQRLGGDPNVLNRTLTLIDLETSDRDGQPHDTLEPQTYTVVGVLPPRFRFPIGAGDFNFRAGELNFRRDGEIWEPESLTPRERERRAVLDLLIARLKPGVAVKQADTEVQTLFRRLRTQNTSVSGVEVLPLTTQVAGTAREALLLLLGATGFVLLIACVNVANLLLARATARQKEFAIRAALGASRLQMFRQVLVESTALGLLSGGLGVLIAYGSLRALLVSNLVVLPRLNEINLDARVLGFALVLSCLTGILFGLAPAVRASLEPVNDALKEGGRGLTEGFRRLRLRGALVIAEVALSLVLLVSAGLLIRSFARVLRVDPGYRPETVFTLRLSLQHPKYTNNTGHLVVAQLLERIEKLPGVQAAGAASWVPVDGGRERFEAFFHMEGRPPPERGKLENLTVERMSFVTPGYFQAMGIPVLKGRDFAQQDLNAGGRRPKIVSESFAHKYYPGQEPLGKHFIGGVGGQGEVVGVVKDTLESGLDAPVRPHLYHVGIDGLRSVAIVIRSARDGKDLAASVTQEVLALDKDQPALSLRPMTQILAGSIAERRFQMLLLGLFAGLALLLAVVGIYSVMAFVVTQRTHEIGVRMALGAQRKDVLKLVIRHGMGLVVSGMVLGLAGAFAAARLLASQLFGVTVTDATTYAVISAGLAFVGLAACYLPARRAARADPIAALRYE